MSGEPTHLSALERLRLLPAPLLLTLLGVLLVSSLALVLSEVSAVISGRHAAAISRVRERLEAVSAFRGLMLDAIASERGYLLTGDKEMLGPFEASVAGYDRVSRRLERLTPAGPLRRSVDEVRLIGRERLAAGTASIALHDARRTRAAIEMERAVPERMQRLRELLAGIEAQSGRELEELVRAPGRPALWTRIATGVCVALIFGLLATVTRLFIAEALRQREAARQRDAEAERLQGLVDARTSELADLSSHLQSVSERDKAELARNLHDELGGLLTAARMDMAWLQGATKAMDPEIGRKLEQLNHALTEAMDVKRRVVENLHPALLDHFGLPIALQSYFEETCRKAGLKCSTSVDEEITDLGEDLGIALFRIGQEALTNIVRHARASTVEMSLRVAGGSRVELLIGDDGVGFSPAASRFTDAHGINGMRYRVQGLGGSFEMSARSGGGTQVRVVVPHGRITQAAPALTPTPDADAVVLSPAAAGARRR